VWLARAEEGDPGIGEQERALLVLAARYLMVLQSQDAGAAAAAVAVTAAVC
jgi:hypothetical protein